MKYIFGSMILALVVLSGCSDKKEEQKSVQPILEQKVEKTVEKIVKKEAEPVQQQTQIKRAAQNLKMTTNKAIDEGAKLAEEITAESKVMAKEVARHTKKITGIAIQKVQEIQKELDSKMNTTSKIDAKQLYIKCAGCHGQNAERKALNMSAVIQGWDKDKIIQAIKGYKNGTYGGAMKTVMTGQVATLSDEEINALSIYISNMK